MRFKFMNKFVIKTKKGKNVIMKRLMEIKLWIEGCRVVIFSLKGLLRIIKSKLLK